MIEKTLCELKELSDGQALGFDPYQQGRDSMFVVKVDGKIRAYRNRCPHQQAYLEYRKDHFLSADRRQIVCHAHNARFDPESGRCVSGPCRGKFLEPIAVKVEGEMLVLVE